MYVSIYMLHRISYRIGMFGRQTIRPIVLVPYATDADGTTAWWIGVLFFGTLVVVVVLLLYY